MRKSRYPFGRLLLLTVLAAGCSSEASSPLGQPDGSTPPPPAPGVFESDLPNSTNGSRPPGATAGAKGESSAPAADSASGGMEAERAISEADIIQTAGDRLYALSRVAGLTIIDMTDPAHLTVLGRYRELHGTPFEMYLRDGVVLAMYTSWGQYARQPDGKYSWVQTSKVIALDVADARAIAPLGSFDIAGEVSDSRIVGDVMYVVGYQNGSCWSCEQQKPRTTVLSLNVRNPRQVQKVDELAFGDANNKYGWNKRSITVTDKRMYVAGPEYGTEPTGSTIQVVDISDPSGDLVEGATVQAAGQISSRWQMDEYQGVLRVISQVPSWQRNTVNKPLMQTFTVASSASVTPLATAAITIPPNELLNTVRFDGVRGYAITSERTDPLFTLDFSDPAQPRQVGELEMPGWIYYLAPRGNRLIGLGYDQGNPQGSLTVSLFDVTQLATPILLDRVNFGGDWANLPEDQDRIHKAFRILDDRGLILVPFNGWSYDFSGRNCASNFRSGVQLVDLRGDDLTLRGAAPSRGAARRALFHKDKLLAVSDEAVDSYDLTNRDQPAQVGRLTIARYVSRALPLANQSVARINEDWYGRQNSTLDFASVAELDRPDTTLGSLNLSEQLEPNQTCHGYTWIDNAFARGNQVVLTYQRYNYGAVNAAPTRTTGLLVVDATDPAKPSITGKLESVESLRDLDRGGWYAFQDYYRFGYTPMQQNVLLLENTLVFLEGRHVYANGSSTQEQRLRVIDLRDPGAPTQALLALPQADGYSGLVADGGNVLLSHYENTTVGRGRFYVDRIDLGNPAAPTLASTINVPGSPLHFDRAHQRMLNSELVRTIVPDVTPKQCYERFAYADFAYSSANTSPTETTVGTCTGYRERLHLVRLTTEGAALEESYELGERERISSSSMGDGRIAAVIGRGYRGWWGYYPAIDCLGPCGGLGYMSNEPMQILTLDGLATGDLRVGRLTVENMSEPWWGFWGEGQIYAFGARALVQSQTDALVVDLTDVTLPSVVRKVPLYAPPVHVAASGNTVMLALGTMGAQRIDL